MEIKEFYVIRIFKHNAFIKSKTTFVNCISIAKMFKDKSKAVEYADKLEDTTSYKGLNVIKCKISY